eukprot:3532357-Amphidinium_carterae.2
MKIYHDILNHQKILSHSPKTSRRLSAPTQMCSTLTADYSNTRSTKVKRTGLHYNATEPTRVDLRLGDNYILHTAKVKELNNYIRLAE